MSAPKGGIKLRRSSKHKSKYTTQRVRTARNKHNQAARRTRRHTYWTSPAGRVRMALKAAARN